MKGKLKDPDSINGWMVRAERAEAKVEELEKRNSELAKMIEFDNGNILMDWMDAHERVCNQRDELEKRIKRLDVVRAVAYLHLPHKQLQHLICDLEKMDKEEKESNDE